MARTYLSGNNSRGSEVTGMNATFSHLRGWNAGVRVQWRPDTSGDINRDVFSVYMTAGSNGEGPDVLLGQVRDTSAGPQWVRLDPASTTDEEPCTVVQVHLDEADRENPE